MSLAALVAVAGIVHGNVEAGQIGPQEYPQHIGPAKIGVLATQYNLGTSRRIEQALCIQVRSRYQDVECVGLRTEAPDTALDEPRYYATLAQSLDLSHLVTITFNTVYTARKGGRRPVYNESHNSAKLFVVPPWGVRVLYDVTVHDMPAGYLIEQQQVEGSSSFHGMHYYAKDIAQLVDEQLVAPSLRAYAMQPR